MTTRFTSVDGKIFVVEEIKDIDNDPWVYYKNAATGARYSCRLEAFSARFYPLVNES